MRFAWVIFYTSIQPVANMSTPNDRSIAIVGMGCRFAGDATSPDKLWELLEHGQNVWSPIDKSRFNASGIYHPNGQRIGSVYLTRCNYHI